MRRTTSLVAGFACLFVAIVSARQNAPPAPTFRAGVELLQLDVSVLDKARRPVDGLAASDFTVSIDGKVHPVVAFKAVSLPPKAATPTAPWVRDIAPDVVSNLPSSGRIVAILIDDYSFIETGIGASGLQKARQIALSAVEQLGPDDRAGVFFSANAHTAQGFTLDRQLLRHAIESSALSTGEGLSQHDAAQQAFCYCGACPMEVLTSIAQALRSVPEQRKIVMYVSAGSVVLIPRSERTALSVRPDFCTPIKRDAAHDALRMTQLANVTVAAIDPKGLVMGRLSTNANRASAGNQSTVELLEDPSTLRLQFLRTLSESTGGRAVVNNNDMELEVPSLLDESSSYYLLGVEPSSRVENGRFHDVRVRVNRRDVEVRTRSGYYDATEKQRRAAADANASNDAAFSIAGAMPRSDLPLDVTVAPFAMADRQPMVAITLAARPPAKGETRPLPRTDVIDVVANLFNPETGSRAGERSHALRVDWAADDEAVGHYEVFSAIPARAGRYEVRIGVATEGGPDASVYTYVTVPDFAGEPLALSGLVIEATPSPRSAPTDEFTGLLPLTPTARRTFARTDRASVMLRVYQLKSRAFAPAAVTARIMDTSNAAVWDSAATLSSDDSLETDHHVDLPLDRLVPGEYLLSVEVAAAGRQARRDLRFTVR